MADGGKVEARVKSLVAFFMAEGWGISDRYEGGLRRITEAVKLCGCADCRDIVDLTALAEHLEREGQ